MITDREREQRFITWWEEHRGVFQRIARAYAETEADRADLLQDMAVQLWRSLPGFREQCLPITWVYRVCLNTALSWQRGDRTRRTTFGSEFDALELVRCEAPRPGWTHEKEELLNRLYAHIRLLKPAERTLILLSLDGLSYREIGELTGMKDNHVGVALTRARQTLAENMKEVRGEL